MSAYSQLVKWDEETKIPQMDLNQIKSMLCPLSNGDPMRCVGCKSIGGCPAGQRAVVLLDKETSHITGGEAMKEKGRQNCFEAMQQEDPIAFLMEKNGIGKRAAYQRIYEWKKRYPDIMDGIKVHDRDKEQKENLRKALESGDPVKWYSHNHRIPPSRSRVIIENGLKKYPELKDIGKDEVSITDFLSEIEQETAVESASNETVKEKPIEENKPVETEKKAVFGATVVEIELNRKYEEIASEKRRVEDQIKTLEERLKWLDSQQDALATVKNLFVQNTAIGKSLSTE